MIKKNNWFGFINLFIKFFKGKPFFTSKPERISVNSSNKLDSLRKVTISSFKTLIPFFSI